MVGEVFNNFNNSVINYLVMLTDLMLMVIQ